MMLCPIFIASAVINLPLYNHMRIMRWFCLLILLFVASTNEEESQNQQVPRKIYRQQSEQIKLQQRKKRNAIGIEGTNYKSYNFKLNKSSEFILKPAEDQEVRAVFDTYWNLNNVYLQAAVLNGEEIIVSIEDQEKKGIVNETFYTTAGTTFQALAGKTYKITAKENGMQIKIIMMHLSEAVAASSKTAKRDEMAKVHSHLLVAKVKLDNSLKSAITELMIENKTSQQILRHTSIYASFEIVQALLIAAAAIVEVKLVINLLKTDTII